MTVAAVALDRQTDMIRITDLARNRAMNAWKSVNFNDLDGSWSQLAPTVTQQVVSAQLTLARSSDTFTNKMSAAAGFVQDRSSVVAEAFAGVDGVGRDLGGTLYGAVTATKTAVGAGFAREQALQAGQAYLGVIVKTLIADASRGADKASAMGKGYTYYVRVVGGSACSRCAMLAGIRSAPEPFARHVSCQCTAAPVDVPGKDTPKLGEGVFSSPDEYFQSLSAAEQDRVFTQAGAEAIRNGADITQVVNARRGADGIGYASHGGGRGNNIPRGHFVKTTIGYRPDGTPVQVYTTSEGTTRRGAFGKQQVLMGSTGRVRLMPETIMQIAGHDKAVAQAFLRDAGYLEYRPTHGYTPDWFARILPEQRRQDRILVDRATLRYGNFTLG